MGIPTRICRGWRACLESPLSSLETGLLSIAAIVSFRSQRDRWFLAVSAGAILASEVASGMAAGRAFAVAGARERGSRAIAAPCEWPFFRRPSP